MGRLIGWVAKYFSISALLSGIVVYGTMLLTAAGGIWYYKHKYDTRVIAAYVAEQKELGAEVLADQQKAFGNNLTEYIAGVRTDEKIAPLVTNALFAVCVRAVPTDADAGRADVPAPVGRVSGGNARTPDRQLLEAVDESLKLCRQFRRKHNALSRDAIAAGAQRD